MAEIGDSRLENVVQYNIFDTRSCKEEAAVAASTQETLYNILSYSQLLVEDYIWQNDSFNLRALESNKDEGKQISCFEGSTNFGDNMDDEWFIVYLLLSITKKFPHLAITVKDNDGEFLLIEAADYLPKWLEPETSENRVFLFQGKLHIIPLPTSPSEITILPAGKPTINQALNILKEHSARSIAMPWIQDSVMRKVQEFPVKGKTLSHHVLCYLPVAIKHLLQKKPSLIANAVTAFINRNPIDVKKSCSMKHFNFESLVPYRVRFTKCLYAQLYKQDFSPDRSSLKSLPEASSNTYKAHLIGLKLTLGFEILYTKQCRTSDGMPSATLEGHLWEKYLNTLKQHGYFKKEVEGSLQYCQLLENAKEYYSRSFHNAEESPGNFNEIEKLLQDMPDSGNRSLEVSNDFPPDDDESWLEISPNELESLLSQYGTKGQFNHCPDVDLNQVVYGMNSFVDTVSSFEGAEFPAELCEKDHIQFNPEEFIRSVNQFCYTESGIAEGGSSGENDSSEEDGAIDEQYSEYTSAMDKELFSTNVGKSFITESEKKSYLDKETDDGSKASDKPNNKNEIEPVDIDLNLVQNFLESYSLQEGMPGPVSNILNSMGIPLPHSYENSSSVKSTK